MGGAAVSFSQNVCRREGNALSAFSKRVILHPNHHRDVLPAISGCFANKTSETVPALRCHIRLYILPFMGHMRMGETLQRFYNWLGTASQHGRKKALNRNSIMRISGLTSRMFKVAHEMKIIDDTPFKTTLLHIRSHRGGHHKALPDAEVSRIKREIPSLQDERQRLYMALLVYTGMKRVVVFPNNAKAVVKEKPKTEASERTFIIPAALKQILLPHQKESGYIIHGEGEYTPGSYSTFQRTYYGAFKKLGIYGKYSNHDWRSTFGSQLKEQGMSSALVADLLGHADTRMVETTYARTRHEWVMKQREAVERLNAFL